MGTWHYVPGDQPVEPCLAKPFAPQTAHQLDGQVHEATPIHNPVDPRLQHGKTHQPVSASTHLSYGGRLNSFSMKLQTFLVGVEVTSARFPDFNFREEVWGLPPARLSMGAFFAHISDPCAPVTLASCA